MKTVTGGVIAAKPISFPKAATLLSSFVSSENGASQAVGAYLRRASAAFSELKSFHVELKSCPLKETCVRSDVTHERNQDLKAEINEAKKEKNKKKKSKDIIEDDESVLLEVDIESEGRSEKKKKRKSDREMHLVEKKSKKKTREHS